MPTARKGAGQQEGRSTADYAVFAGKYTGNVSAYYNNPGANGIGTNTGGTSYGKNTRFI